MQIGDLGIHAATMTMLG